MATATASGEGGDLRRIRRPLTCLCLKPYSNCRLWPVASKIGKTHIVRPGVASGPSNCTKTLLDDLSQLCATFFHANSWEAGVKVCLTGRPTRMVRPSCRSTSCRPRGGVRKCNKSQVAVIARLVRMSRHDAPSSSTLQQPKLLPPGDEGGAPTGGRRRARGRRLLRGGLKGEAAVEL